jgi:hypothetical protein
MLKMVRGADKSLGSRFDEARSHGKRRHEEKSLEATQG